VIDTRFLAVRSVLAISLLSAVDASAQNVRSENPPVAAAQASSSLPDACKMMPQSDLEALFPGMPVTKREPQLSPIYRGRQYVPQYIQICTYAVELPDPTSKYNNTKSVWLQILGWSTESTPDQAASQLPRLRESEERLAANPRLNRRIEPVAGVGDEAFMVIDPNNIAINARKDDLIFIVNVATYSRQTQPNAIALAGQVAKRWRGGVGVVEASTPIAANTSVDVPPDTRVSRTAPASEWPDACGLLPPEDVRKVFGDMKVDPPRKTMAKLTHNSRVDRVEDLPYPVSCSYHAVRTDLVNGRSTVRTNGIEIRINDVAATLEAAKETLPAPC
jgi:hypothetical protein